MKFFSVYSDWSSGFSVPELLESYGHKQADYEDEADVIVFNGGPDIATSLYGEKPITGLHNFQPYARDLFETETYLRWVGRVKFLGICRGAQMLNVLNGGSLWQDVDGHYYDHMIIDTIGTRRLKATSSHHQQMILGRTGHGIAYAEVSQIKKRYGQVLEDPGKDWEVVWYPLTDSLCIQGHPEYGSATAEYRDYCKQLIEDYLCAG